MGGGCGGRWLGGWGECYLFNCSIFSLFLINKS